MVFEDIERRAEGQLDRPPMLAAELAGQAPGADFKFEVKPAIVV
jgi:hypothetical protein